MCDPYTIALFCLVLAARIVADASQKDLEIEGRRLVSQLILALHE